jgi:nucleotide-binding universal stress UspA family protein
VNSTILVPLDGSKRAEAILRHVQDLARCNSAAVVLLHVVAPGPYWFSHGKDYLVPREEFERRTEQAECYLTTLKERCREKGIEARTRVLYCPVVDGIMNATKLEGADLIAMSTHGRTGLSRVLHGSVAAGVLRRADRPLLLIRSGSGRKKEAVASRVL